MSAGAACGPGIYLSDDINVSFGYGLSGKKSVVGVFEIIDKPKYNKGGPIHVVNDEKALIQRYLLIIPQNNKTQFLSKVTANSHKEKQNYLNNFNVLFNKQIHKEEINITAKYTKKCITKIIREYQLLVKANNTNFRIDVNPDYPFLWKIFIGKFDDKYLIAKDMKKFGVKEIEMEIRFPDGYPFDPPYIRVVQPRFMHLTAHVTSGGSICNEILTNKGWLPTCSIESLITIIVCEIIEGDGRLDPTKYHIPYSYEESKESFYRVARSHGWM
jgi:ubiquitin-protein ligase